MQQLIPFRAKLSDHYPSTAEVLRKEKDLTGSVYDGIIKTSGLIIKNLLCHANAIGMNWA